MGVFIMSINRDKLQETLDPALRVRPRVGWGVLTYFLYSAVFYAIFLLNGIDYTRVGESERTLLLWYIAPLSGGAVLTITMVTIYGWWRPSLVERRRLSRSTMTLPIIMMVIAIVNMLIGDFTRVTPSCGCISFSAVSWSASMRR